MTLSNEGSRYTDFQGDYPVRQIFFHCHQGYTYETMVRQDKHEEKINSALYEEGKPQQKKISERNKGGSLKKIPRKKAKFRIDTI